MLRRELQEKHLHCLEESSVVGSSSDVAADSMLLSFVHNAQSANNPKSIRATSSTEASLSEKSSDDTSLERYANHGKYFQHVQIMIPHFRTKINC